MVFGNMGDTSATGVAFTRDPATGEKAYYGEYLINAQGEDVVAGIRTPQYLTKAARERAGAKPLSMEEAMPEVTPSWLAVFDTARNPLSRHAGHRVHGASRASSGCSRPARASAPPRPHQDRGRYGDRGADQRGRSGRRVDPRSARPAAPPDARSQGAARCADQGAAGLPGAASGEIVFDADTAERAPSWARRHPRAHRNLAPKTFTACTPRRAS
ncbi:MAG: hypothetical protein LKM31_00940 [Sphingobium sp.]|jgi:pyruvate,orthophosphate dikinase|nr:hypothetical protein [Sphingobium sp.]